MQAQAKILVIEDNMIARKMAKIAFEDEGCYVDCVTTGKEAITKINKNYDLILVDLGLPDMDGLEVAKIIRQTLPPTNQVTIIALTAHSELEKSQVTKNAGMDGFITKPLTMDKCLRMLHDLNKKICN